MTVRAAVCDIVRTQAGPMNGAPNRPLTRLIKQDSTMSKWNPDPFLRFFSGLLRIRLLERRIEVEIRCGGRAGGGSLVAVGWRKVEKIGDKE